MKESLLERWAYWNQQIMDLLPIRCSLRRHGGGWSLRWREAGEDGVVRHRSRQIPEEDRVLVDKAIHKFVSLLEYRRNCERQIRDTARLRCREYRKQRAMLMSSLPPGRSLKRDAGILFDQYCQSDPEHMEQHAMFIGMTARRKKRGRPPKASDQKAQPDPQTFDEEF